MDKGFTFDDVLIMPRYSEIASRSLIDTSTEFLGVHFRIPIISANMDHVTGSDMAIAMWEAGGLGILHRFYPDKISRIEDIDKVKYSSKSPTSSPLAFSIGLNDIDKLYLLNRFHPPHTNTFITIDVAHGHHKRVGELIREIKSKFPQYKIIAGNIATYQGFRFLAESGADAIKVGIGAGSVCTTRIVTGVGIPQLTAINECVVAQRHYPNVKIIADGGINTSGDLIKALAAGADMVMLGSLLAGTDEAPAPVLAGTDGRKYKAYRGQSIFGSNGDTYTPEGIAGYVPAKGPVKDVLRELEAGLRSGMSYVGSSTLGELQAKAEFIEVSPLSMTENHTRVLKSLGD